MKQITFDVADQESLRRILVDMSEKKEYATASERLAIICIDQPDFTKYFLIPKSQVSPLSVRSAAVFFPTTPTL